MIHNFNDQPCPAFSLYQKGETVKLVQEDVEVTIAEKECGKDGWEYLLIFPDMDYYEAMNIYQIWATDKDLASL